MTQQVINIGTTANDHTGDPLRTAFQKINTNFTELYSSTDVDNYVALSTTGQTITDTTGGTNYTLKIANGTTGAIFAIGTGTDAYGIANDSLNHNASGYVPYNATASSISFNIPGHANSLSINTSGVVSVNTLSISGTGTALNVSAGNITTNQITGTQLNFLSGAYTISLATSGTTASYTLNLPTSTGTANQVLKTDGSGNLGWASGYPGIPGPYANDSAAGTAGVGIGNPYYQSSGQVFVRRT